MSGHENSLFKVGLNLAAACILSGAVIAFTYSITAPVAAEQAVLQKQKAMQELVPNAQSFQELTGKPQWMVAMRDNKQLAYIIPAEGKGYGGTIKMVVAVSPEAKVVDYKILAHNETPGLGDKAAKEPFRKQFAGKELKRLKVKNRPTKDIQALTGATITSKAVTNIVKSAVEQVIEFKKVSR